MTQDQPNDTRRAIFHFVDGTQLNLEWPKQAPKGIFALSSATEKAIAAQQFAVEVGGKLMVIQMASVKYIEVIPCPENLPEGVLRNARQIT